jgi:hypothetical protein
VTATVLAVLALAGGAFFLRAAATRPQLAGRQTRTRRLAARALQGVYLVCGLLLVVRGAIGLLAGSS